MSNVAEHDLRLLIFDFDGVIINSHPLMQHAFAAACELCLVEEPPRVEEFLKFMGMPLPDIVRHLALPTGFVAAYQAVCRRRMQMVTPYEGASDLLSVARERTDRLALVTGKDRQRTLLLLERFRLADLFDWIICGDDPYPGKPAPAAVNALLALSGLTVDRAAMVGDSPIDIECARRAGVMALGAGWGFSPVGDLERAGAREIFASPGALIEWLRLHQSAAVTRSDATSTRTTLAERTGTNG